MTKNIKIALVVILVIATLGMFFPREKTVVERVTEKLGGVPTLDGVDNPYISIGGVSQYWYSQPLTSTSSIPCSIKNPYNATTTLLNYGINVTSVGNVLLDQIFDVSTSTSQFGSSSPAFIKAARSGGAGPFYALWIPVGTTTNTLIGQAGNNNLASTSQVIIGASEYVNFRISTTTPGTFSTYWQGSCTGIFQKL